MMVIWGQFSDPLRVDIELRNKFRDNSIAPRCTTNATLSDIHPVFPFWRRLASKLIDLPKFTERQTDQGFNLREWPKTIRK